MKPRAKIWGLKVDVNQALSLDDAEHSIAKCILHKLHTATSSACLHGKQCVKGSLLGAAVEKDTLVYPWHTAVWN